MNDKKRQILADKCTRIRDMIIDSQLTTGEQLKKIVKKELNKKELEELATQFLLKESLDIMLEKLQDKKEMTLQDLDMYA